MRYTPVIALYILCVLVLAWALPAFYDVVFEKDIDKTHLFYSPVEKKAIYTEQLYAHDPIAAQKSDTHHADVVYKDEDGTYYSRTEFEANIPFIYFRNMEMRGLLPIEIDGKYFTRAQIEKARRVLELPARRLDERMHIDACYPLLESQPGQVALVLPADRFRMTSSQMQFVHSDSNSVDTITTELFTTALHEVGFQFPAHGVWGNFTVFKPYDAGVFILDSLGKTYRVRRVKGAPHVTKLSFPEHIVPRKIIVSETPNRELVGLLLDTNHSLYILHENTLSLTHIPVAKYNANTMDSKILFDPLYITAIYSDDSTMYMDVFSNENHLSSFDTLKHIHSYEHTMSKGSTTPHTYIKGVLFPFTLSFTTASSSIGCVNGSVSPLPFFALCFSFAMSLLYGWIHRGTARSLLLLQMVCILLLGVYGAIPFYFMHRKQA